jgi:hypothetical protein
MRKHAYLSVLTECSLPSLGPDLAHSGLPYCHFGIHLSHLHPHRCLPVSIFRLFPFYLAHRYHIAYFLIVSSSCNSLLEGDRLIRLKGARLFRHLHSFTDMFIFESSARCPQGLLYSVGISMSIQLKTLDISCSSLITSSAILWYVLLFSPTSRSGRPISLKERGRLPGWYSSKIFQGEQQKYLTKVEEFTKNNMEIECSSNSCLSLASNA